MDYTITLDAWDVTLAAGAVALFLCVFYAGGRTDGFRAGRMRGRRAGYEDGLRDGFLRGERSIAASLVGDFRKAHPDIASLHQKVSPDTYPQPTASPALSYLEDQAAKFGPDWREQLGQKARERRIARDWPNGRYQKD